MATWINEAEDRYRRSLTWLPAVGTIYEHYLVFKGGGSSHVNYKFDVDSKQYTGSRFRSGGIHEEEAVTNPMLLGTGTQLVVYYNPANPMENAIKIQHDRVSEALFGVGILMCLGVAYRSVRCETIIPNLFYRFIGGNRRMNEPTGMKQQRSHAKQGQKFGRTY
jgi:hypothetical protein